MKKRERIYVSQENIDNGECGNGRKCPIRLGVKDSLNLGHGYCHVDATGISITRKGDWREKAFIVKSALRWLLDYDKRKPVRPFSFWATFHNTTPVTKLTAAQRKEYTVRARANGNSKKQYKKQSRLVGVSL